MMKAEQLRIGNWVDIPQLLGEFQVQEFTSTKVIIDRDLPSIKIDMVKPIPLTEEWLVKGGFEKSENFFHLNQGIIIYYSERVGFHKVIDGVLFKFPYVHTLQNFMALTGEELTFNL